MNKNREAFRVAGTFKLSKLSLRRVVATTVLSFLSLGYVSTSYGDIILTGDITEDTGELSFTTDYNLRITTNSQAAALIFDGWGNPPDSAEDGVNGTGAIRVEINGIDTGIDRMQLHDNFAASGNDITADDSFWFFAPKPAVSIGDVVTIRSGSTPLTFTPYWNPVVSGTFTGNLFLIDVEGRRISEFVSAVPAPTTVSIDIKPGKEINKINLRKKRKLIPVAVLGSIEFDATQVDFSTVTFGPGDASPVHQGHVKDVNGDGFMDMKFHFKTKLIGIECGDTEASLAGETFSGESITGTDSLKTVKCN